MTQTHPVLAADSGVVRDTEAYTRRTTWSNWSDVDPTRLALVDILVHRIPTGSHLEVRLWSDSKGWEMVDAVPPDQFWSGMPGYLRWNGTSAEGRTFRESRLLIKRFSDRVNSGALTF